MAIYYTTPLHYTAAINDATGGDSSRHFLLDSNLDTVYLPLSGTGDVEIHIDTYPQDLGEYEAGRGRPSGSTESVGVFLTNFDTDFSAADIQISISSDSINWTVETNSSWNHLNGPLFFFDLTTTRTSRYYRFIFTSLPATPKISQLFLLRKHDLDRPHGFPVSDVPEYFSKSFVTGSGRVHVIRTARDPITLYQRNYLLLFPADHTLSETIFNDCNGPNNPFILQEGTTVSDAVVCRMIKNIGQWSDVEDSVRTVTYEFTSLPFIRPGEST